MSGIAFLTRRGVHGTQLVKMLSVVHSYSYNCVFIV